MPQLTPQLFIFVILAIITVGAGLACVRTSNLFHAALFLVLTLFGVAGLYTLLEAEFLAVAQLLIYVGAISTLIVFAIMLSRGLARGGGNPRNEQAGVAAWSTIVLFILLAFLLIQVNWPLLAQPAQAVPEDAIIRLGNLFLGEYVVPFEIASVLLLVALIGAIIVAREKTT